MDYDGFVDTTIIIVLVLLGAGLTVYGSARAYVDARRQVVREQSRTMELTARERTALAAIPNDAAHQAERNAAQEAWNRQYAAEGLHRASWGNLSQLSQYEALRLVRDLLLGARTNLVIAGLGVLASTGASVWDLARG